jgi:hypothetical protein
LASDDSFLESRSTTIVSEGNVETIDARHPELTDTAATFYRPLPRVYDLDETSAFVNDPLDDDTSDDETCELCKGSDEDRMRSGVLSDDSLDDSYSDTGELISQGFREMVSELLVVLLNRKRKRDELDGRADFEPLTTHSWERKKTRGRAGSSADRPTVLEDDGAAAGPNTLLGQPDPIVLTDSDSNKDDCGSDVARDGDAADESIAPTPESADDDECFG